MSDTERDDNQPDRSDKNWTRNEREWSGTLYYSDIWTIFWTINGWDSGQKKKQKNHANEQYIFMGVTLVYGL